MNQNSCDYIKNKFSYHIEGDVVDLGCGTTKMILELCNTLEIKGRIYGVDDDRDGRIKEYIGLSVEEFANQYSEAIRNRYYYLLSTLANYDLSKITIIPKSIENFIQDPELDQFELIVVNNVLHYYTDELERLATYASIYNILSDSGSVYIQLASENHTPYQESDDKVVFTLDQIKDEISNTEFEFIDLPQRIGNNNWHFMLKK